MNLLHFSIYPCSVLTTLAWVFYSKWQFSQFNGLSKNKWHAYGAFIRAMYFVQALSLYYVPNRWEDVCLAGSISIVVYEIGLNVFALQHVSVFYIGTSSKFDALKSAKWYIVFGQLVAFILVKIIF